MNNLSSLRNAANAASPRNLRNRLSGLFFVFILAGNALFLKYRMLYGFDPQDYGGFLDVAWRILRGQKPYIDFQFHVVPLYVYGMAGLIKILGFNKITLWAGLVLDSSIAASAVFWGVRKRLTPRLAFLVTMLTAVGFHWAYCFPIYDTYTAMTGILALWLLAGFMPFETEGHAFWIAFAAGIFMILSVMMKLTDGLALGFAGLLFVVFTQRYPRHAFLGYTAGCWAGLLLTLPLISSFKLFWLQSFVYYNASQVGRFQTFLYPSNWLTHGYILPALLAGFLVLSRIRVRREWVALIAGTAFAGIFAFNLGSMKHTGHMPLTGTLAAFTFLMLREIPEDLLSRFQRNLVRVSRVFMVLFCLYQAGVCAFFAWWSMSGNKRHHLYGPCCNYTLQSKPLDGWKVYEVWGPAVDGLVPYMQEHVPAGDSVLILSDLQILNLLTGRDSYKGITFQFKWGLGPLPGPQTDIVRDNILSHPPEWLITYKDSSPFALNVMLPYIGIQDFVIKGYIPVKNWGPYILMRRKDNFEALSLSGDHAR